MKKIIWLMIGLFGTMPAVYAADLKDVFQQAQSSDPTYKQAQANYLQSKASLGQARANLLPNLALTGTWGNTYSDVNAATGSTAQSGNTNTTTAGYSLTLTQSLFNWNYLKNYQDIKLTIKASAATYAAAAQGLIMRTAQAYFNVLLAQDMLRYTDAQLIALNRQLAVAKQRYEVGLDPITSVYDAQAQYDAMQATYIANQNTLATNKESLRQITNQLYPSLATLKDDFPLVSPKPADIDQWTKIAEQQNSSLIAANYTALAAKEAIGAQNTQLPSLSADGTYARNTATNLDSKAGVSTKASGYGLTLTVPVFDGGAASSKVTQAEYAYEGDIDQMEITHRAVVAATRNAYLGVVATISQIEADRQAIKSAQASLASNQAGYKVGTQTILDVLTAQSTLYKAQTTYAQDRFTYVINTLTLKQSAGTLTAQDVDDINHWLVTSAVMPAATMTGEEPVKKSLTTTPTAQKPVVKNIPVKKAVAKKTVVKKPVVKKTTAKKNKTTHHKKALKKNPVKKAQSPGEARMSAVAE